MARRYTRDARGRFASGGFSGQTGGRGARLMAKGTRAGGGARMQAAGPKGTIGKPRGLKPGAVRPRPPAKPTETTAARFGWIRGPKLQGVTRARLSGRQMSEGAGLRGKRRQARQERMGMMRQMLGRVKPGPSAEPLTTGKGTLAARTSLRGSRAKLAANPTPSQRGAVTRANRYANMAKASNRQALGQSPAGRLVRGKGRRGEPKVSPTTVMGRPGEGGRQPKASEVMRGALRSMAQSDARFYRSLERDFGIKIAPPQPSRAKALSPAAGGAGSSGRPGKVSTALREGLRSLAQADARRLRDIAAITREAPGGALRGSSSRARLSGSKPRLGPGKRRKG